MTKASSQASPNPLALLPFALFLALFVSTGLFFSQQETDYAFYQLPAPVAILPAIILAIGLHPKTLNETLNQFIAGAGQNPILTMCLIYLMAGAFSAVTKGIEATVNLGLAFVPEQLILPGLFVISAFVATAMGTSIGTIAAIAPVALGLAEAAEISKPFMAGVVLSGAMLGDNLSIISDTTIAAAKTQGCSMRDKFIENLYMVLPAAFLTILLFYLLQPTSSPISAESSNWLLVLPYISVLAMAIAGWNVFAVLAVGLVMAGLIGYASQGYALLQFGQDIHSGFTNMQEIFVLSLLIGGLSHLIKLQGGPDQATELQYFTL